MLKETNSKVEQGVNNLRLSLFPNSICLGSAQIEKHVVLVETSKTTKKIQPGTRSTVVPDC